MNDEFKWVCPGRSINEWWIHHQIPATIEKMEPCQIEGRCEWNINSLTKITKWIGYCKIASRIGSGLKSSNLRGEWIQNDLGNPGPRTTDRVKKKRRLQMLLLNQIQLMLVSPNYDLPEQNVFFNIVIVQLQYLILKKWKYQLCHTCHMYVQVLQS